MFNIYIFCLTYLFVGVLCGPIKERINGSKTSPYKRPYTTIDNQHFKNTNNTKDLLVKKVILNT